MSKSYYLLCDTDKYFGQLTEIQRQCLVIHCNRYEIAPDIIASYKSIDEFAAFCREEFGDSEDQAKLRLRNNDGEFCVFGPDKIIRLRQVL